MHHYNGSALRHLTHSGDHEPMSRQCNDPDCSEYCRRCFPECPAPMPPRPTRKRGRSASPNYDDFTEEDWDAAFSIMAPERKRSRIETSDTDTDTDTGGSPVPMMPDMKNEYTEQRNGAGAAYVFYWRWTYCSLHGQTVDQFKDSKTAAAIKVGLKAFGGAKTKFIFQLEDPTRCGGNLHYQGFINLAEKKRIGALINAFNTPTFMPGCQVGYASTAGKEALKAYCMKADSRVAGPWWDKPGEPPVPYEGADMPAKWWPWQQEVIDTIMHTKPDDRTIHYIVDSVGKNGKSKVSKYLMWQGVARTFQWVEAKNAYYSISKEGGRRAYIFDLTRTKPKKMSPDDIYSMIESIKNGMVDGSLYENEAVLFDPPHVWVFANMPPKKDALSADRFVLHDIDSAHRLIPYIPPPTDDASVPSEGSTKDHQRQGSGAPPRIMSSTTTSASRVNESVDEEESYE